MILRFAAVALAVWAGTPAGAGAEEAPPPAQQQQPVAPPVEPPQMGMPAAPDIAVKGDLAPETITLAARPALTYSGEADWDDSEKALSSAINLLYATVARSKLEVAGSPMVEYLDNGDDQFQFKAYLPIQPGATGPFVKDVTLGETPAGTVLKYAHQGSYEDLEDVYSRIEDQLTADKKEMKRVVEEYVSDPQSTSLDQMLTNIYVFTE